MNELYSQDLPKRDLRRVFLASLLGVLLLGGTAPAEEMREGVLEVLVSDDFQSASSRVFYRLETKDGVLLLDFEREPPPNLATGDHLRVRGHQLGETFTVEREELVSAALATPTPGSTHLILDVVGYFE